MRNVRVAINGFGRIGRVLTRLLANDPSVDIVAINDLHEPEALRHLLKYDSVHRTFPGDVTLKGSSLTFGRQRVQLVSDADPEKLPWEALGVDLVIECTGKFKTKELAQKHLSAGAKKVIISAPPEDDELQTIVIGVNDDILNGEEAIFSNASCTTNSAAPMIQLLHDACEIESCYITTVHSYTTDQHIQDAPHRDLRRGRAAALSIVPTTTGAAKALTRIFPELSLNMGGCGIRVPVPDGSLTDITCIVKNPKPVEELNRLFKESSENQYKGILQYTEDPIVSSDIIGNPHSCIVDGLLTSVIGRMVKIVGWYDNEVGYSTRLVDLIHRSKV